MAQNFACAGEAVPGVWKVTAGHQEAPAQKTGCPKLATSTKQRIAYFPSWPSIPDILFQFILAYLSTMKLIPFESLPQQPFQWLSLQSPVPRALNNFIPRWPSEVTAPAQKTLLAGKRLAQNAYWKGFLVLSNYVSLEILVILKWSICHVLQGGIALAKESL